MKIAITGATGMIGSSLAELALENGYEVIAVIRPDSPRRGNLPDSTGLKIIECGISELKELEGKEKCDMFFHLGWEKTSVSGRDDVYVQEKNIRYTLDAVALAHSWGASVFVGAGSQAEYGPAGVRLKGDTPANPESGYGIAKYAAGKLSGLMCASLGMRFCWARILSVYGEKDAEHTLVMYLIRTISAGEVPELTECGQIWDYIYSEDAAAALLAIGRYGKNGKIYPVGSGKCRPMKDFVSDIRDAVNPKAEIKFGAKEYYPHQAMFLCADISELTEDTGFVPKYGFKEGIARTVSRMP
ncbi:MAG: NAD-dependent epimerase/dehydratase family protein [Candidatus Methanomethylophilaceae archaeon]|jgi:UDP-glucose 4-epimerase